MSFLSRSHHSTVTNYSEFVENLRTGKQKPPGNIPPLQAMEEFFKELGNFLKDNNFRNLDEVLEAAKNGKETSRSTTMDYRKYHGSEPETWEARHLENFASNMGPGSILGAGLLQHLADALMHSGYNNLGELIEGAKRADSLQEQISHRNVRIENLEAEIRIQDAKYTRLDRSYMDAVQNLRLVTESRDGKEIYISQLKEKLEHNRDVRDSLNKDNERLRRELREKEQAAKPTTVKMSLVTLNRVGSNLSPCIEIATVLQDIFGPFKAQEVFNQLMEGKKVVVDVPLDKVDAISNVLTFARRV